MILQQRFYQLLQKYSIEDQVKDSLWNTLEKNFIDKPFIYTTNEFRHLYENQAKLNLTNELNTL